MEIHIDASSLYLAGEKLGALRKNMPFAIRRTLTAVARNAENAIRAEMQAVFDRPTPYTLRAIYSKGASGKSPVAIVALREFGGGRPAKYLAPEVLGGARHVKAFEKALNAKGLLPPGMVVVPAPSTPLDAYGNISRGLIGKILSQLGARYDAAMNETARSKARRMRGAVPQAAYFALPKQHGKLRPGIYARYGFAHGSAVRPIMYFHRMPTYHKRLRLWDLAIETVQKTARAEFAIAIEGALSSARPSPP